MRLNAIVTHEPPWYVARCVEVDVATQGGTAEEATENLRAALTLAAPAVAAPHAPPLLTEVDVPVRVVASGDDTDGVDRVAFARRAKLAGWQTERHGDSEAFRGRGCLVWLPLGAERVAPGVYRMLDVLDGRVPESVAAEVLDRMDALFARHPHGDDTTQVIREQRDAG